MISEKHSAAARANGAKSRGPLTPEGKAKSSQNAIRHGLLAAMVLLDDESPEDFQALSHLLMKRFKPADGLELTLIEDMASSIWRSRRSWAIEGELLKEELTKHPHLFGPPRIAAAYSALSTRPELPLLQRYETRLHMIFHRSLSTIRSLQEDTAEPRRRRKPKKAAPPQPDMDLPDLDSPDLDLYEDDCDSTEDLEYPEPVFLPASPDRLPRPQAAMPPAEIPNEPTPAPATPPVAPHAEVECAPAESAVPPAAIPNEPSSLPIDDEALTPQQKARNEFIDRLLLNSVTVPLRSGNSY